jgi:hypothetical protein
MFPLQCHTSSARGQDRGMEPGVEQKQRFGATRLATLLGVLALHIMLFMPALRLHLRQSPRTAAESSMELFWMAEPRRNPSPTAPELPSKARREPLRRSPVADQSTALTAEPITAQPAARAPSVDWHAQLVNAAEAAARRQIELDEQRGRFAPREPLSGLQSKEKLDAGWNEYRFKRVESQPGGTIVHLSERCVLVISGFILPACTLRKPKASGEMYERMKESRRERADHPLDDLP